MTSPAMQRQFPNEASKSIDNSTTFRDEPHADVEEVRRMEEEADDARAEREENDNGRPGRKGLSRQAKITEKNP